MNKNNNSLITFRTHKNNSFFDREENFEVNNFFLFCIRKLFSTFIHAKVSLSNITQILSFKDTITKNLVFRSNNSSY